MKLFKVSMILVLFFVSGVIEAEAQIKINKPKKVAEQKASSRANRKIDHTIDKGLDKLEEGIGSIFKKKDKDKDTKKEEKNKESADRDDEPTNAGRVADGSPAADEDEDASADKVTLQAYNKYDFMPGEKIVASEDFSQDADGDFPAKWNTNGMATVVTIEDIPGKWLMIQNSRNTSFIPEFVKNMPDNFTLEFDLIYNNWEPRHVYQRRFFMAMHETKNNDDRIQSKAAGRGALLEIDGNMGNGKIHLYQTNSSGGYTQIRGDRDMKSTINSDNNGKIFHIALWRQKTRLRVYVDEQKVLDMARIFPTDINLNSMRFHTDLSEEGEQVFISNIRLAVGSPDTRSKLITEGKFVTTGITFDVNSATIRPESYAVLKDIAGTLTENPGVKVRIIGHTDSDGEEEFNLNLSKKRADAVSEALVEDFGIDKSRLQTDGKGESTPVAPNATPEGKANNRRVEFVKM